MARVVVTGATGFVGRPTVAALTARGAAVHRGPRRDLLDPAGRAALIDEAGAEILVHLAWVTEHGAFWSSPLNAAWEAASRDLFARFYAAGGRRIVATGSCAEYDWSTGAEVLAEDAALAPHTVYGAAKARTGAALADLAAARGGSAAWGRVFFLFGPGEPERRLIPAMIAACARGEPLDCGPAATVRDFWHVKHLGAALAALALSDLTGAINLASGRATRFDEIGRVIERAFGAEGLIRFDARALGPGEPARLVADTTRLAGLGLAPARLEADLAGYCALWRGG